MQKYKNFTEFEFNHLSPSCSLDDMDEAFMNRLQTARDLARIPFRLSSAYRSPQWEIQKGRSGTSWHCKGKAVDILCRSSFDRYIIVCSLLNAGFCGIGIHSNFIHVDARPEETMFTY